jgi:hypothetical protein
MVNFLDRAALMEDNCGSLNGGKRSSVFACSIFIASSARRLPSFSVDTDIRLYYIFVKETRLYVR